jgi:hypothetical protein
MMVEPPKKTKGPEHALRAFVLVGGCGKGIRAWG